jgi:hypothetical protein
VPSITELYGRHQGEDIYVVGTGASMRVFPLSFLENKITIGLNRAWEILPVSYCISMVPHLNFPEFLEKPDVPGTIWVTKRDKYQPYATEAQMARADREYFYFRTDGQPSYTTLDEPSEAGRVSAWAAQPTGDFLYLWTSISQSAVNLAANMGARNVILVGCDNAALLGNHHAHDQHTLWKGADPELRYLQYYEGLVEVRKALRRRNVNVLSLGPFLKVDAPELDFRRLCEELDKSEHISNQDIYRPPSIREQNVRFLRMARSILRLNVLAARARVQRVLRRQ